MRIIACEQGSPEWRAARRGMPTASQFHRILSPAKLKMSEQSFDYLDALVAERLLGIDVDTEATAFMDRGKIMEDEAVRWYEFQRGIETQRVGFVTRDVDIPWSDGSVRQGVIGCSPDRLVGDEGGLELKCPSAAVHVGYLRKGLGTKYRLQVQGALWITGRAWWDVLSYNPDLPPALERVHPEPEVFAAFDEALPAFLGRLEEAEQRLRGGAVVAGDAAPPARPGLPAGAYDDVGARASVDRRLLAEPTPNGTPPDDILAQQALIAFYSVVRQAEKALGRAMIQTDSDSLCFIAMDIIDRALVGVEKSGPVTIERYNKQVIDAARLHRLYEGTKALLRARTTEA